MMIHTLKTPSDLPDKFADFFLNKIRKIREQFHKKVHKGYTIGNAQVSMLSCQWIERKYSI